MGLDGQDQEATDDEALYGREYLDWKKQTLGAQVNKDRGKVKMETNLAFKGLVLDWFVVFYQGFLDRMLFIKFCLQTVWVL